ncbi:hypothetical protein PLICRDRAFT_173297 [Plicaturopsis crispa FD-325 SS-3]|nr:hypothetical protein PLICRDRAFT_173297 [Plicaturopsis crispa FD-325 SS-3]
MDYGPPILRAPPGKKASGINCQEFRGCGPPTALTGDTRVKPGDIYIDMSGDIPGGRYRVYANYEDGWREWTGDTSTDRTSPQMWHPVPSRPEMAKPLHEVFYFAFGPYIKPSWVSLTTYRAAVKTNQAKVQDLMSTSSPIPPTLAYPRSAHTCVSALLNKERTKGKYTTTTKTTKRKTGGDDVPTQPKRVRTERPGEEMDTGTPNPGLDAMGMDGLNSGDDSGGYSVGNALQLNNGIRHALSNSEHTASGNASSAERLAKSVQTDAVERTGQGIQTDHAGITERPAMASSFQAEVLESMVSLSLDEETLPERIEWTAPRSPAVSSLSSLTDDTELESDIYITPYAGTCWPKEARLLKWKNGLRTVGPWQSAPGETNFDLEIAEFLTRARDGAGPGRNPSYPGYVVLDFEPRPSPDRRRPPVPDSENETMQVYVDLERDVRLALSQNKPVVVRDIPEDAGMWFTEGSVGLVAVLDQNLQWQDRAVWLTRSDTEEAEPNAAERKTQDRTQVDESEVPVYKWTTIREFIALSKDPNVCGNLLDLPQMRASYFRLISQLSDDGKAWDSTKDVGLADIPAHPKPGDKNSRGISSHRKRWDSAAPQCITLDQTKLGQWILLTHAGFLTHIHHDAAGLATWVSVQGGSLKIWAIVVPKVTAMHHDRDSIFERFGETLEEAVRWAKVMEEEDIADVYWTFLEPGQTLFMPPGAFHLVLTATPSVALGGHFYTYESMHLTEMSRSFDHRHSESATNTEHAAAERAIARMALALPTHARSRETMLRRPFAALARMILRHEEYTTQAEQRHPVPLADFDLLRNETANDLKYASWIVMTVMIANKISRDDLDEITQRGGPDYDQPGLETVSLECLRSIDDIRTMDPPAGVGKFR